MKRHFAVLTCLVLTACETPLTPRYSVSPENVSYIRKSNTSGVSIGQIAEPPKDAIQCRMGAKLRVQDDLSHAQYIRKALQDELMIAGAYAESDPRVVITGQLQHINASSMVGLTAGRWQMKLLLQSSNGKTMTVEEDYQFKSGFMANDACRNVTQSFMPAVQNLVRKVVSSPEFPALVR
jgi:hypothetical protein